MGAPKPGYKMHACRVDSWAPAYMDRNPASPCSTTGIRGGGSSSRYSVACHPSSSVKHCNEPARGTAWQLPLHRPAVLMQAKRHSGQLQQHHTPGGGGGGAGGRGGSGGNSGHSTTAEGTMGSAHSCAVRLVTVLWRCMLCSLPACKSAGCCVQARHARTW